MTYIDQYKEKLAERLGKLETFKDFRKKDDTINKAYEEAKEIFTHPGSVNNPAGMIIRGHRMATFYGYCASMSIEKKAEYEAAELTCEELRDTILLEISETESKVTIAKTKADLEVVEAKDDVIFRKAQAGYYNAAAEMCSTVVSLAQSSCKVMQMEYSHQGILDRGNNPDEKYAS